MRIYIVGAPDTGKNELAYAAKAVAPHMTIFGMPVYGPDDPSVGVICDYRTELMLALDRMNNTMDEEHGIHTHSLIDSVAYIATACANGVDSFSDETLSTFYVTAHVIAAILRDSFMFDYVLFKPGSTDAFGAQIEGALRAVLDQFGVSYIELNDDKDENLKLIGDLIHGRDVGEGSDTPQLDGND